MNEHQVANGKNEVQPSPFDYLSSTMDHLRRVFRPSPYLRLLGRIHRQLKPRTYVEIGVRWGDSIVLGKRADICVGIDPMPNIKVKLPPVVRIYQATSDAFFAEHNLTAELGGKPLDLAFIDGMHLFEFALRDFINLERHCSRQSTILVHDCYPRDRVTAARERTTAFWSGDVWKLVICLKQHRADLQIRTLNVAPTGLAIIRGLDPASTVLSSRLTQIEREFVAMDFKEIETSKAQKLNRIENNWNHIKAFLGYA